MILCFNRDGDFNLKLEQHETGRRLFRVTYGQHVRDRLTYAEAAHELGECLMHCLACESKLGDTGD